MILISIVNEGSEDDRNEQPHKKYLLNFEQIISQENAEKSKDTLVKNSKN